MLVISVIYLFKAQDELVSKIILFESKNFFLFFGQVFYTSEGVGLILPIRSIFKEKNNFNKFFNGTFSIISWV